MLVADDYLGHRDEERVAARLADAVDGDVHRVVLSEVERRRSRVRTETAADREVGIVVPEELADGDVLETDAGELVVVELAPVDALVVEFGDADVSATEALEMGHALGNRHWDLAVESGRALFPVADSRERTEATVADLLPPGVTTRFERISPAVFDGDAPDHAHGSDRGHGHERDGAHGHDHGPDGGHAGARSRGGFRPGRDGDGAGGTAGDGA
ncbi:urease accessory protein UreE [Candidatus Halobonum tyrrellensis]|uniref:Urease accessory protein UreE n=1 Tax=Candidatus Halobonum tyrrellensis G22 TaxID=1324957 RepID=V4HH62_9EURY|nr:urease accessory protein UreE [Candidatus Halobonum tyrrellensis]ESP90090.1 urease accessory protein UreE [Candidatus Halobonum tyrrellensis G22]